MNFSALTKAGILNLINKGAITDMDAFTKWGVTAQELEEWRRNYSKNGTKGLMIKNIRK